jgi:hypothetical protein
VLGYGGNTPRVTDKYYLVSQLLWFNMQVKDAAVRVDYEF